MAQIRPVLTALDTASPKNAPHSNNHKLARPPNTSRAPTPSLLGSTTQCGSALATEIDSYRRRIQTLLHFFDCIAQHWWDHLYSYKRNLIKRPSKSADEVRSYRTRLLAKLNKFTMRTVVPAASAIATMEAHASVKVLPPNLLSPLAMDFAHGEIPSIVENSDLLLQKACQLARRLGDIERLKQRLLLSALTWITSDGRDLTVRAQRIALLARHAEPCLIEHFSGVRALLTHYYRPRVLVSNHSDEQVSLKLTSSTRMEPITAARLTSTNEEIMNAIETVYPKGHNYLSFHPSIGLDEFSNELPALVAPNLLRTFKDDELHMENAITSFPNVTLLNEDAEFNSSGVKYPVLPSIVLNPLSIDTSQLEWLSYQINQRDLNLHILNMEETQEMDHKRKKSPSSKKLYHKKSSAEQIQTAEKQYLSNRPKHQLLANESPITTPNSKELLWSVSSKETESSGLDDSRSSSVNLLEDEVIQLGDQSFIKEINTASTIKETDKRVTVNKQFAPYGEGSITHERDISTGKVEFSSGSIPGADPRSIAVTTPRGEEETGSDPTVPVAGKPPVQSREIRPVNVVRNSKKMPRPNKRLYKKPKVTNIPIGRQTADGKGAGKLLHDRTAKSVSLRRAQATW